VDQNSQAVEKIRAHHAALLRGLRDRSEALLDAAATGVPVYASQTDLLLYLREEIVPHAAAEEETIYRRGLALRDLVALLHAMMAEHERLRSLTADLEAAAAPVRAASIGLAITELFALHADKENDLLLPRLASEPDVRMHELLGDMHERLEG